MSTVRKYNPGDVLVTAAGQAIQGFADGTFINATRNDDAFTLSVGADGEATRAQSNNRSGRVEITLQQTSPANAILNELANADELSGQGVFGLQAVDRSGSTVIAAERAWVVKKPDTGFAKETENRVWILETNDLVLDNGGNVLL